MLGELIHDQLHRSSVVRPVEKNGLVEQAIFLHQASSAKNKCDIELVFLHIGILEFEGDAGEGGLCAFSVQCKIIISMLAGIAQQFDLMLITVESFVELADGG